MTEFSTIDINGNTCQFQYLMEINDLDNEVTFRVFSIPSDELRWFSYRVKILTDTLVKSEHLNINNHSEFSKKGIPEKIIQIASKELQCSIISSPLNPQNGDFLIENSFKVWERLVAQDKNAVLDAENDCFRYEKDS